MSLDSLRALFRSMQGSVVAAVVVLAACLGGCDAREPVSGGAVAGPTESAATATSPDPGQGADGVVEIHGIVSTGKSVSMQDFLPYIDRAWQGSLTYLDYGSDRRVTIPAELTIRRRDAYSLVFETAYPEEPEQDIDVVVEIEEGGRRFGGEEVIARKRLDDGGVEFETRAFGSDGSFAEAEFVYVYTLSRCAYRVVKNVRPVDQARFYERNRYEFAPLAGQHCN